MALERNSTAVANTCASRASPATPSAGHGSRRRATSSTTAVNTAAAATTGTELALAPVEPSSSSADQRPRSPPSAGTELPRARPQPSPRAARSAAINSTQLYVIDGLPQTMNVAWVPNSWRTPFSKPNSPIVKSSAAGDRAHVRPAAHPPADHRDQHDAASAHSAGIASRRNTVGRSTPLTRLAAPMCAKPNQW